MDLVAIENRLRNFFAQTGGSEIAAVYLFGSVARGTARPGSDVDLGLLYTEDPPRTLAGLGLDLENDLERLLELPVQVVVLNRAPVDLVVRVLRDGKLLFEGNAAKRVRFEVRSRMEFWDLEPFIRRYRGLEERPS